MFQTHGSEHRQPKLNSKENVIPTPGDKVGHMRARLSKSNLPRKIENHTVQFARESRDIGNT